MPWRSIRSSVTDHALENCVAIADTSLVSTSRWHSLLDVLALETWNWLIHLIVKHMTTSFGGSSCHYISESPLKIQTNLWSSTACIHRFLIWTTCLHCSAVPTSYQLLQPTLIVQEHNLVARNRIGNLCHVLRPSCTLWRVNACLLLRVFLSLTQVYLRCCFL